MYVLHKIGSISALVWDTIMKQVAPGSLFNKVYFDFWIIHNRQANLPLALTIERIKCTSMYKHNNGIYKPKTVFVHLLALLPSHSSTSFHCVDANYIQGASRLQKDSFNQSSCVCYLLDKLILKTAFSKHSCLVNVTHTCLLYTSDAADE